MKKKFNIVSLVIFLVLLVGIGGIAFVVSQRRTTSQFDVRKRASTPSGVASIVLESSADERYVGDIFPIRVLLNTGGTLISGVAFRFTYPFGGTSPELEVIDSDPSVAGVQIQSHASTLESSIATNVNLVVRQPETNGTVVIDFSATTTSVTGFSSTEPKLLATIMVKANRPKTVDINHDPVRSMITRKSDGADVLRTIPTKTLKLVDDTQAPGVTLTGGPADGATATVSAVTFTWSGSDNPSRPNDTASPVLFSYQFDNRTPSPFSAATSVSQVLSHGTHTFTLRGKDVTGNTSTPTTPASKRAFTLDLTPRITNISPTHGPSGTPVTIRGYNFGVGSSRVSFGSDTAEIVSWSDTQIVAKPRAGANGEVTVTVDGRKSNGIPFALDTLVDLVFALQGITQDRGVRVVTVVIKRDTTTQRFEGLSARFDASKNAYVATTPPLSEPFAAADTYTLSVDDVSRLRRRFIKVDLKRGVRNIVVKTAAGDTVPVADFNNDNKLTIEDFGLLMTKITSLSVPVTSETTRFDLNADGVLDIGDIGLLLANYTALEKSGDPE